MRVITTRITLLILSRAEQRFILLASYSVRAQSGDNVEDIPFIDRRYAASAVF